MNHESPELKTALRINTALTVAALVVIVMLLTGCDDTRWVVRHVPTTDTERAAVAAQVRMIMVATPRELSGNDQDWDDAIAAATLSASETLCRPTLWERRDYNWTGVWRYVDEPAAKPTRGTRL